MKKDPEMFPNMKDIRARVRLRAVDGFRSRCEIPDHPAGHAREYPTRPRRGLAIDRNALVSALMVRLKAGVPLPPRLNLAYVTCIPGKYGYRDPRYHVPDGFRCSGRPGRAARFLRSGRSG